MGAAEIFPVGDAKPRALKKIDYFSSRQRRKQKYMRFFLRVRTILKVIVENAIKIASGFQSKYCLLKKIILRAAEGI